jgi:lipoprotein NlpI
MNVTRFFRLMLTAMCLVFAVCIVNCYGASKNTSKKAEEKAEEFYKTGKQFSSVENGDYAIYNYSEAIRLNPKMVKAYNNRGVAYIWRKQYDFAIADFDKAIKLDPKNGAAYNNRAIAHWHKGEINKARQDVQKAQSLGIAVNPDFLKKIQEPPSSPK